MQSMETHEQVAGSQPHKHDAQEYQHLHEEGMLSHQMDMLSNPPLLYNDPDLVAKVRAAAELYTAPHKPSEGLSFNVRALHTPSEEPRPGGTIAGQALLELLGANDDRDKHNSDDDDKDVKVDFKVSFVRGS